ncbi:MAG: hypothetical protein EOO75_10880, partial [Myxococcales bacterium]
MIAASLPRAARPALAPAALVLGLTGCGAPVSPSLRVPPRLATAEGAVHSAALRADGPLQVSVPLSAAQARGRWHWRLFGPGTGSARAEYVRPDGTVAHERALRTDPSGDIIETLVDAFGVEIHRTTLRPDGTAQRQWRSGRVALDGCHHLAIERAPDGRRERRRCLSATDAPMVDDEGCLERDLRLDERGLVAQRACLGRAGPALDHDGVHRVVVTRDALGALTEERFEDTAGRPAAKLGGCHGRRVTHHPSGDVASVTCLDAAGAPALDPRTGVATTTVQVDARGCDVRRSHLDARGRLVADRDGVAHVLLDRGPRCELVRQEQRTADGALRLVAGVAVRTHLYDGRGQLTRTACFDEHRLSTNCLGNGQTYGVVLTFAYDDRGRLEHRRAYMASAGESWTAGDIPHLTETTHDDQGRRRLVRYYNEYSRPDTASPSVGQEVYSHDPATGLLARIEYFTWAQARATGSAGCHTVRLTSSPEGLRQ